MAELDRTHLRVELARQNITYTELARLLARPPSTLSTWLRGLGAPPSDLIMQIEAALRLPSGTLSGPTTAKPHDAMNGGAA